MIAPKSVQEVIERADVVEIVGQFVRLKKRGSNWLGNCPFHHEKTPSFSVSASKGIYKCFGCGKGGNSVTFIQEHEKLTFPETIRWLANYYRIELEETVQSDEQLQVRREEESLRILNEWATDLFHQQLLDSEEGQAAGLSYLKQRGLRRVTMERFRLGYAMEDSDSFYRQALQQQYKEDILLKSGLVKESSGRHYDAYRGRVIFPIQNMTGRVLGFGARLLKKNDKAPKYINTPENELYIKSKVLYGLYQARQAIAKENECFLVEGYLDVISLSQAGVENVVASSGTSLTEDQLRSIGQLTRHLTILYDGDAAGIKAALRGMDMALAQSFDVQVALLPEGEDPDSYIQKNGYSGFLAYVQENKEDVIGFRLKVGLKEAGDDAVKRSKLTNEIADSISKIDKAEDFSLQHDFIKKASNRLGVDQGGLTNLVNKFIRDRLEQERRLKFQEKDRLPPPPDAANTEQAGQPPPPAMAGPVTVAEQQEWQLIKMLLMHGSKPYNEEYANVATAIYQHADPELLEQPLAKELYLDYFDIYTPNRNTAGTETLYPARKPGLCPQNRNHSGRKRAHKPQLGKAEREHAPASGAAIYGGCG